MKKVVRILLAILMVACLALSITACKSECEKGNHDKYVKTEDNATCTSAKVEHWACKNCDWTDDVTSGDPLGHDYTGVQWQPSATDDAKHDRTCVRTGCGYKETADHKTGAATCPDCGKTLTTVKPHTHDYTGAAWTPTADKSQHQRTCIVEGCGHVETANHTPVTVPGTPANCTTAGKQDGSKCSTCNHVITEGAVIPALEHDYTGAAWTPTADKSQHQRTCTRTGCGHIETAAHKFEKDVALSTAATCLDAGNDYLACVCGEHQDKVVNPLGHDYQENNWTTGDGKHWHECRRQGCDAKIAEGVHEYESEDALRCKICHNPKDGVNFVLSYGPEDNKTEKAFNTLVEAIASVTDDTEVLIEMGTIDGSVIRESTGIKIPSGRNITINFKGKTYMVSKNLVGSSGTETNGFQILAGSNVTLMNGTISVKAGTGAFILIQNYANLTLNDITIDGSNLAVPSKGYNYTLSNNCGEVTLTNSTHIIGSETGVALDLWYNMNGWYPQGVNVTVGPKSTIGGVIEYGSAQADVADLAAKLTLALPQLTAGEYNIRFTGNVSDCDNTGITVGGAKLPHKEHDLAAIAPDCTNSGLTAGVDCSRCGKVITAQTTVDALGHDFDATIEANCSDRIPSTCEVKGSVTVKCSRCDETESQQLPLAEHTITDQTGHDDHHHWDICDVCSKPVNDEEHTYANCCDDCDFAIDDKTVVDALYALDDKASLDGIYKLSGLVISTATYNPSKKTITVNMKVDGRIIQCYTMYDAEGNGTFGSADVVSLGQTITVSGTLKRYGTTYEFDSGCRLLNAEYTNANVTYTITDGSSVTGWPANNVAMSGSQIEFTIVPADGTKVGTITLGEGEISSVALKEGNTYTLNVLGDTTLKIEMVDANAKEVQWQKVDTLDKLGLVNNEDTATIIIVENTGNFAMGTTQTKFRNNISITTPSDGSNISNANVSADIAIITITKVEGGYTLYITNGDNKGYLAPKYNANEMYTQDTASIWTIDNNLQFTQQVTNGSKTESRYIKYNASSPRFSCYKSGQVDIVMYVKVEVTPA